jgi:hypothetical protein
VIFSGDFAHRRAFGQTAIEGAPAGTESYYREGIVGSNFTATSQQHHLVPFRNFRLKP